MLHYLLFEILDFIPGPVLLLPVFVLLYLLYLHDIRKTARLYIFAAYLSGVYAVTGLPSIKELCFDPNFNFLPFADMFYSVTDCILNVLLFVPLGFLLPLLWTDFQKAGKTILFGLYMSIGVELLQMFVIVRATDVDDLLLNTLGAVIGYLLFRLFRRKLPDCASDNTKELTVVMVLTFAVMFFLEPWLTNWLWSTLYDTPYF